MDSNVWKENRIAPLEYCSFERAAKLLNCECEDLIHWNKIGAISIAFRPENMEGSFSVQLREQKDSADIEKYNKSKYIMHELGIHGSQFLRNLGDANDKGYIASIDEFRFYGNISDLWVVINGSVDEKNSITITKSFSTGYKTLSPANIPNDIISALFFYQGTKDVILELKDLLITMSDIEKIWTSAISGKPMDSYFTSKVREIKAIPVSSVSIVQTDRHEHNRQVVEQVAMKVREHYPDECTKNGKLLLNKWVEATLARKNDYGGMKLRSVRKISTILSEIIKAEKTAE